MYKTNGVSIPVSRREFLVSSSALLGSMSLPAVAQTTPIVQRFFNLQFDFLSFPNPREYWGLENVRFYPRDAFSKYMRVRVPKGAIDPGTMARRGLPRGGAGFKSKVFPNGVTRAELAYSVRFPEGFAFVRGGKLPGLYGGKGNSGGSIPTGADGFSTRLMWGPDGLGQIYAYLPTSTIHGTALLWRKFRFLPGKWHRVVLELTLNTPGSRNGIARFWLDGVFVGEERSLLIRTVDSLRIDGLFFDFFFGGNDDSWAPPADTYVDFAEFVLNGYP